ncbi:MAG TPA: DUF72 domain-containing protein [Armatimonadota bacterium]|jgi:uncharacterized protein YecE (DUF72 family)
MREIRVGTSGWSYPHWRGRFYPEGLAADQELEYYAGVFDTVELNTTFYHTVRESTAQKWHDRTPPGFRFAVKGNRYLTHNRKLHDCAEPLQLQRRSLAPLAEKLGPLLWQLPPNFGADLPRLADFLALKPPRERWAWEFRHESWFCAEVYAVLREHHCALVWADGPAQPPDPPAPTDFLYVRFHGLAASDAGNYSEQDLRTWAQRLQAAGEDRDLYAYFNNDYQAYAPANAARLRELLSEGR